MAQFTKNPGQVLQNIYKGILEAVPLRWRAKRELTLERVRVDKKVIPDDPTGNIIISSVEQENTGERWLWTGYINDDTSPMVEKEMIDGLSATRNLTLVDEGSALPALSHLTISAKQENYGNGKVQLEVTTVPAYLTKQGQEFDRELGIIRPWSSIIKAMGDDIGDASKEITPINHLGADVKTWGTNNDALDAFFTSSFGTFNLSLPSELLDIETYWSESSGAGEALTASDSTFFSTGEDTGNINVPANSEESGSSALIPKVIPNVQRKNGDNMPCQIVTFFLPSNSNETDLVNKVNTNTGLGADMWPRFQTATYTIICKGQKVSARASVDLYLNRAESDELVAVSRSSKTGTSYDISDSVQDVVIGPVINDTIFITDAIRTVDAEASVDSVITGDYGFENSAEARKEVEAEITPTVLPATPIPSVPTSGWYLTDVRQRPYSPGYNFYQAVLFDASKITSV